MDTEKDTRQRRYFQTYRSETKTLALCRDESPEMGMTLASFVNVRVRIRKEDRRLPLQFYCAFEPDGGSPDMAVISGRIQPEVTVREMVLLNRSYIPVVNRVGSTSLGGALAFPGRQGSLGFAIDINADCDAIDISLHLGQALGEVGPTGTRYSGRWICGYSITCNDRLSAEEWQSAVSKCNMQVECFSDQEQGGAPVLYNVGLTIFDTSIGEDTEGTGGINIPNGITLTGTGELG